MLVVTRIEIYEKKKDNDICAMTTFVGLLSVVEDVDVIFYYLLWFHHSSLSKQIHVL